MRTLLKCQIPDYNCMQFFKSQKLLERNACLSIQRRPNSNPASNICFNLEFEIIGFRISDYFEVTAFLQLKLKETVCIWFW